MYHLRRAALFSRATALRFLYRLLRASASHTLHQPRRPSPRDTSAENSTHGFISCFV